MLGNKKIVKATGTVSSSCTRKCVACLVLEDYMSRLTRFLAGGGAHKFAELFERKLGVQLKKEDEMAALVRSLTRDASHACG
jgi:pantothenate kinase